MAYRLRYSFNVDWVGPGQGPTGSPQSPGLGSSGNSQTLGLFNSPGGQNIGGTGTAGAIAAADITALAAAMEADVIAQLNLPVNLALMDGWVTGQNGQGS